MDRFGAERTLAIGFAVNAVALLLFLVVPSGFLSWGALLLLIGACTGGSQFAIVSLAAALYPSSILATGSGWASAVARIGAFASPLVGGALLAAGVAPVQVIAGLAAPAPVCRYFDAGAVAGAAAGVTRDLGRIVSGVRFLRPGRAQIVWHGTESRLHRDNAVLVTLKDSRNPQVCGSW